MGKNFCVVCCITTVIQLHSFIVCINLFYIINILLEHDLYRFCHYNSKYGKFIFCFGTKLVPTIWQILFFYLSKVIVCDILTLSTLFMILFFNNQTQNQLSLLILHDNFYPLIIDNGEEFFVLFVASLQSYNYGVT